MMGVAQWIDGMRGWLPPEVIMLLVVFVSAVRPTLAACSHIFHHPYTNPLGIDAAIVYSRVHCSRLIFQLLPLFLLVVLDFLHSPSASNPHPPTTSLSPPPYLARLTLLCRARFR